MQSLIIIANDMNHKMYMRVHKFMGEYTNVHAQLQEMRRVVKPTGKILLLENSVSSDALLGAYMRATGMFVCIHFHTNVSISPYL